METRASDRFNSLMNDDPAKLSLSNFLAGESDDPLQAPASFTNWMRVCAWAVQLYEPELLATAEIDHRPRLAAIIDHRARICSREEIRLIQFNRPHADAHSICEARWSLQRVVAFSL